MSIKTYVFRVSIPRAGRAFRKIEMRADQTLADLHHAIQDAFEFDNDHLYSFFMSGKAWDDQTEYSLPEGYDPFGLVDDAALWEEEEPTVDLTDPEAILRMLLNTDNIIEIEAAKARMGDSWHAQMLNYAESFATPGNVLTTRLAQLNLEKGKEFLYLFDYGDEWRFKVKVSKINDNASEAESYPRIVESKGTPPKQYPDWDDFDEEEE